MIWSLLIRLVTIGAPGIRNSWCFWSPQRECSWSCTAKAATEEFVALVRRTAWGRWALLDLTWFDWFTQCDVYLHLQPVALPNFSWLCEVSFHNFHVKCVRHGALEAHRVYKAGSYWIWGYFERHGEPLFSSHMLDLSEEPLVGTRRAHKHG